MNYNSAIQKNHDSHVQISSRMHVCKYQSSFHVLRSFFDSQMDPLTSGHSSRNNPDAQSRHKDSLCPGAMVGEAYGPRCYRVMDVAIDFWSK